MLRKLTIAFAAAATLGAAALAPSTASAKPIGFGGYHHHFGGWGVVGLVDAAVDAAVVSESCYVSQRVLTPRGYRWRTVNVCAD
ncbi:MAG TPA: hypothetical protein VFL62_00255 [Bradyrhizobium sp.]|uniref:hypothetical protein n=1 Tax=Bradyrhizobium sp. TaxID=376 RepID=UPI002D803099|nr:hypothetical protein [Bradyrhizobium sp.]HET7884629.1 hypothetical protein [Bradyrhizobium sp.]